MNVPKFSDMSKEQIKQILIKKKECDIKALQIVERLIENPVSTEWFYCSLKFINQCHLQDIIEERAISKLCGYPICLNNLGFIPQKKYIISTKQNKVYDIDERKNFCSNQCYKSAIFIKEQMLTSPLWLRDKEEIPHFKLLPLQTSGCIGIEVDLGIVRANIDPPSNSSESLVSCREEPKNITSDSAQTSCFINKDLCEVFNSKVVLKNIVGETSKIETEGNGNEQNINSTSSIDETVVDQSSQSINSGVPAKNSARTSKENVLNLDQNTGKNPTVKKIPDTCDINNTLLKKQNLTNVGISSDKKKSKKSLEELTAKLKIVKESRIKLIDPLPIRQPECTLLVKDDTEQVLDTRNERRLKDICKKIPQGVDTEHLVRHVEKCIFEWFTIETMNFLNNFEGGLNRKSTGEDLDVRIEKRYSKLCKNINSLELEDNTFHKSLVANELKPVPDFEALKKQSQQLELKVKSFFQGNLEVGSCKGISTDQPAIKSDDVVPVNLPLMDSNSQLTLRRRIIFNYVNKLIVSILQLFGVDTVDVLSQLHQIILTFHLTSKNVLFKPYHLNLLSLIIIKMLSRKYVTLKQSLEKHTAVKYLNVLLSTYKLPNNYLDDFIIRVYDVISK